MRSGRPRSQPAIRVRWFPGAGNEHRQIAPAVGGSVRQPAGTTSTGTGEWASTPSLTEPRGRGASPRPRRPTTIVSAPEALGHPEQHVDRRPVLAHHVDVGRIRTRHGSVGLVDLLGDLGCGPVAALLEEPDGVHDRERSPQRRRPPQRPGQGDGGPVRTVDADDDGCARRHQADATGPRANGATCAASDAPQRSARRSSPSSSGPGVPPTQKLAAPGEVSAPIAAQPPAHRLRRRSRDAAHADAGVERRRPRPPARPLQPRQPLPHARAGGAGRALIERGLPCRRPGHPERVGRAAHHDEVVAVDPRPARPRPRRPPPGRCSATPAATARATASVLPNIDSNTISAVIVGLLGHLHRAGRGARRTRAEGHRSPLVRRSGKPWRCPQPSRRRPRRCSTTSDRRPTSSCRSANGEPVALLDAVEAHADRLHRPPRPPDARPPRPPVPARRLRRPAAPRLVLPLPRHPAVLVGRDDRSRPRELQRDAGHPADDAPTTRSCWPASSPVDRHGYFSLGVSADYVASFIGRGRFFLEANRQMPRTFGRNQLHVSQVEGWTEVDRPLVDRRTGPGRRHRRAHRRPRRRAGARRRHDPGRHRRHPQRHRRRAGRPP